MTCPKALDEQVSLFYGIYGHEKVRSEHETEEIGS